MQFIVRSKLGDDVVAPRKHPGAESAVRDAIHRFACGQDDVTVTTPDAQVYRYHQFPTMMQKYGTVRQDG